MTRATAVPEDVFEVQEVQQVSPLITQFHQFFTKGEKGSISTNKPVQLSPALLLHPALDVKNILPPVNEARATGHHLACNDSASQEALAPALKVPRAP